MEIEGSGKQHEEWKGDTPRTIAELKKQVQIRGPFVAASFLQYSLQMISVIFVGHLDEPSHLDEPPLSSASMALSFADVTGFSILLGMNGALETLCGQAYGAKQYHMLGVHMQKAMLVLMLMGLPHSINLGMHRHIFILCGQDMEIGTQAEIFARWLIPRIFPYGLLQCLLEFLQAQNNVKVLMMSAVITSVAHVFICWTLVFIIGLGHKGAALSIAISYWINVVILAIKFSHACQNTWTGFCKEGTKDLASFPSVTIPTAFMVWYVSTILRKLGNISHCAISRTKLSSYVFLSFETMQQVYNTSLK